MRNINYNKALARVNDVIENGLVIAIVLSLIALFVFYPNISNAKSWTDDYEFNILGINPRDFKGRQWQYIVVGGAVSILSHELGHMAVNEIIGTGRTSFDPCRFVVHYGNDAQGMSDDQIAFRTGAGLIVQSLGSIILTSIPATRHSDFTLGWNTGTFITGMNYGITKGKDPDTSDVVWMNYYDWPGTEIAYGTGIIGGITAYISLDKEN